MAYVMVPVPEEHVAEAMQAVVRMVARAEVVDWDDGSIADLWAASDGPTRLVLSAVADAVVGGRGITLEALAGATGLTARQVLGVVQEVNEAANNASRPPMLLHRATGAHLPDQGSRAGGVLSMPRPVAVALSTAERARSTATRVPSPPASAPEGEHDG